MKNCKTANGLIKAVKKGENAILPIWDVMNNDFVEGGAYLNLGEGKYTYLGKQNWQSIRNNVVHFSNHRLYFKDEPQYAKYYQ